MIRIRAAGISALALLASTGALAAAPAPAARAASTRADLAALRREIEEQRATLQRQQALIEAQQARLQALETRIAAAAPAPAPASAPTATASAASPSSPGTVPLPPSPPPSGGVQTVGEAPSDQRQVQVAALAEQGGIITRARRLTLEAALEYAHADRNRVVFRGIEIPQAVLVGVFDINESRQDVLTAAAIARYGVTGRLEVNARVPFVYRVDKTVLAPVADPNNPNAGQIDSPVKGASLGDVDFGVRYQFTNGTGGRPYLIAGIQAIAPTGTNPFGVRRDAIGNALKAATGAGFWAVSPSITAILPSDPAVLFGTLGYTYNFARKIGRQVGGAFVDRVSPGGEPSGTVGIALALNPRTSLSFGYAHTWAFGTRTVLRPIDPQTGALGDRVKNKTRDLQLGRFLFGVSYRTNRRTTINWNLELGATDDATDIRTTLRIPIAFDW